MAEPGFEPKISGLTLPITYSIVYSPNKYLLNADYVPEAMLEDREHRADEILALVSRHVNKQVNKAPSVMYVPQN